jgi:surfactin synthase thioesterase subunit
MMRFMPKVWKQMKQSAPTLQNDATILGDFTVPTERFSTIAVPTIVIGGGKGKANMKAAVQGVAAAIPGSRLKFLEGQTHQVSDASLAPELVAFFSA